MKLTAILHTHGQREVTLDTIESIMAYVTDQILLVIDDAGYANFDVQSLPVLSLQGFYHGYHRSPYRNIALGLHNAYQRWPNSDWYFYLEYDALIGSPTFVKDLAEAEKKNIWIMGNDYRRNQQNLRHPVKLPLIEAMLKEEFDEIYYLLGACLFYNKKFMKKLNEENFLEKLLHYTNDFQQGFFPGFEGPAAWDLIEHLMPTLAKHWGGEIGQFAKWSDKTYEWFGNYRRYPIRWQPELSLVEEYLQASIMHPLKTFDHPIRVFHRDKRLRLMKEKLNVGQNIEPVTVFG